jgi:UDPglucose 6-dehydrogenase
MHTNVIGVIGLGFVGTAVQKGFEVHTQVVTFDIAKPCTESSIDSVVQKAPIIFICVPTPMNIDGTCNIDIVKSVLADIAAVPVTHRPICVLKSTVVPGTTAALAVQFPSLTLCFNPEFLTERNYIEDFNTQQHIILGHTDLPIQSVVDLYEARFPSAQVITVPAREAEMIKYVANTLLATKVAYLNEIYQVCQRAGVDYTTVADVLALDSRLGNSHWKVPGPDGKFGFGGTCFPKDINALIQYAYTIGQETPLLTAVWHKNLTLRPERDWELDKGRAVV